MAKNSKKKSAAAKKSARPKARTGTAAKGKPKPTGTAGKAKAGAKSAATGKAAKAKKRPVAKVAQVKKAVKKAPAKKAAGTRGASGTTKGKKAVAKAAVKKKTVVRSTSAGKKTASKKTAAPKKKAPVSKVGKAPSRPAQKAPAKRTVVKKEGPATAEKARGTAVAKPAPTPVERPLVARPPVKKAKKDRYQLEFYLNATPASLFDLISSPSGFSEWFCDDVDVHDTVYIFKWGEDQESAECLLNRYNELMRFRWEEDVNDDPNAFFELRIRVDGMTNETCLVVTDHAWPQDLDESKALWESQIHTLTRVLGA